ncbi:MAG: FHA domain-containing protein [Gemmatimonadota bacterium]|jgi:hypothetical protein|nr:FHA domain-containing protein [Gemmatimonadota bacterium]
MLNPLRKFFRPTLREQLEAGIRDALRLYAERHTSPHLRVYVSTDLVKQGVDPTLWARDEAEHLRRFALQWAEDNQVPRTGLRIDVVLLDTKREFAFVKPLAVELPDAEEPGAAGSAVPSAARGGRISGGAAGAGPDTAVLEVISSTSGAKPLTVRGELIVGRNPEGSEVTGLGDRYMSGRHARFHFAGGRLYITDLDSRNRTWVNDHPLPPHEPLSLSVGDVIRMGSTRLRVARLGEP